MPKRSDKDATETFIYCDQCVRLVKTKTHCGQPTKKIGWKTKKKEAKDG